MFTAGKVEAVDTVAPPAQEASVRIHEPHNPLLSPSIQRVIGEQIAAFELKFLVEERLAQEIQQWATTRMQPDAYADPALGGAYQTTTLYLDTPARDVFHRSPGQRGRKYRLRRYGSEQQVHLERKTRRGDRVKKRRSQVPLEELALLATATQPPLWPGEWFGQRIAAQNLRPACLITYERVAYVQLSSEGPLRLTLDRQIRGVASEAWDLTPVAPGPGILPTLVVCEFKFRGALPNLFKELIHALQLEAGSVSKYRRTMLQAAAAGGEGPSNV